MNHDHQMKRFVMYRRGDISATHNEFQANKPDEIQFEGIVFSDGTTVLRWRTGGKSTSVWNSFEEAMAIHGHPEERYQSELVLLDVDELNNTSNVVPKPIPPKNVNENMKIFGVFPLDVFGGSKNT